MQYPINLKNLKRQRKIEEEEEEETEKKMDDDCDTTMKRLTNRRLVALLAVITLCSVSAASYFYILNAKLRDPQKVAQKEIEQLVARIGALIVLPGGEQPTMATVTDPEKLKDQPFFSKAKAGDKVLIYTNARKAILYDPAQNKIIEVAPLNIGN